MKQKTTGKAYEHPRGSGIRLSPRTHSTKTGDKTSWQVNLPIKLIGHCESWKKGKKAGKPRPIRKLLPSENLAKGWAEQKYVEFKNRRNLANSLNDKQLIEAAGALEIVQPLDLSLIDAAKIAATAYRWATQRKQKLDEFWPALDKRLTPSGGLKRLSGVIQELIEGKLSRLNRGDLRPRSYDDFRKRSVKFGQDFGHMPVDEITSDLILEWLAGLTNPKTGKVLAYRSVRNYGNTIGEIFKYCIAKEYCTGSPLDRLTDHEKKKLYGSANSDQEPPILTPIQAQRLIETAYSHSGLELLPTVILGLFCGVRTTEIQRLEWDAVNLDRGWVIISAQVAKKRTIRNIEMPKCAKAWLSICYQKQGRIFPKGVSSFRKRFQKLYKAADFEQWRNNAMRHSFGSYHYALHEDSIKTANLLGYKAGDDVLFTSYRALVPDREVARAYFEIYPAEKASKVVPYIAAQ